MTIVNVVQNPRSKKAQFFDVLERTLWTAAEGAGATGIIAGYQALSLPNIPREYLPLVIIIVGAILAALKSIIAQQSGNGTAATLPSSLEPIPADTQAFTTVDPNVDANGDGRSDVTGRFVKQDPQNDSSGDLYDS